MPFIDEIDLHLRAGRGGDGIVSWLHEKGKEFMGPAGGNGGRGGDVYARAVSDIAMLASYRHQKRFSAEDGNKGEGKGRHGKAGESLYIDVPVGTILVNKETGWEYDMTEVGAEVRLLVGGDGGFGNKHFKNSRNTKPKETTPGRDGMEADFHLELRLIADVGIVGLPNAGKSSLLNHLTRADAKVGDYAFTTLTPNLGVSGGFVLADVPGLIKGASDGKGLGHAFLRHLQRTKMLLHTIAVDGGSPIDQYKVIHDELLDFDQRFSQKKEIVLLTKSDVLSEEECRKQVVELQGLTNSPIIPISVVTGQGIEELKATMSKTLSDIKKQL